MVNIAEGAQPVDRDAIDQPLDSVRDILLDVGEHARRKARHRREQNERRLALAQTAPLSCRGNQERGFAGTGHSAAQALNAARVKPFAPDSRPREGSWTPDASFLGPKRWAIMTRCLRRGAPTICALTLDHPHRRIWR